MQNHLFSVFSFCAISFQKWRSKKCLNCTQPTIWMCACVCIDRFEMWTQISDQSHKVRGKHWALWLNNSTAHSQLLLSALCLLQSLFMFAIYFCPKAEELPVSNNVVTAFKLLRALSTDGALRSHFWPQCFLRLILVYTRSQNLNQLLLPHKAFSSLDDRNFYPRPTL